MKEKAKSKVARVKKVVKEVKDGVAGKSAVVTESAKVGIEATEGVVKQLGEELENVKGLREFVNKGADALAMRLLGGQNLYTDEMVELLRKRLTCAWEHSRVLGEYEAVLGAAKGLFERQLAREKPIEPEVVG